MSTTFAEAPASATRVRMRDALDAQETKRSMGDLFRSAPRRARDLVGGVLHSLKLDTLAETVWRNLKTLGGRALAESRTVGLANIAGTVATSPRLRRGAIGLLFRAYAIVKAPLDIAGRGLGWALAQLRLQRVNTAFKVGVAKSELFAAGQLAKGLDWADRHQENTAVQVAAAWFQGSIVANILNRFVPARFRMVVTLARLLFIPQALGISPQSLGRKVEHLVEDVVPSSDPLAAVVAPSDDNDLPQPVSERVRVTKDGRKIDAVRTVNHLNEVWYEIEGTHYESTDFPEDLVSRDLDLLARDADAAKKAAEAPRLTTRDQQRQAARVEGRAASKAAQAANDVRTKAAARA